MKTAAAIRTIAAACAGMIPLAIAGCGSPSKANIDLRRQNQELQTRIAELERTHAADLATIQGLQKGTTLPSLPSDRLDQLFTVHGLQFGRLTGGDRVNPTGTGDDVLKVFVVPTDDSGEKLKAAGSFTIEAFDLALPSDQKIGTWNFSVDDARKSWFGNGLLYTYVLACPWQKLPAHANVTVKTTFTDALTGRMFSDQRSVHIEVPPASPTTRP